jgi:hypothetical protein
VIGRLGVGPAREQPRTAPRSRSLCTPVSRRPTSPPPILSHHPLALSPSWLKLDKTGRHGDGYLARPPALTPPVRGERGSRPCAQESHSHSQPSFPQQSPGSMQIAYVVMAHTAPRQFCRMVDRLDDGQARFLIHVDQRSPRTVYEQARRILAGNPNVTFVRRRPCRRCTFDQVAVTLRALHHLVHDARPADYAILLTGQDYPLKPTDAITAHLERSNRACFLHAFPMDDPTRSEWPPSEVMRYRDWHLWVNGAHIRVPLNRRIPGQPDPYGGSAYWALPFDAVVYLCDFVARERRFVRFFHHVHDPDEIFFHTILMNSPLRERVKSLTAPRCHGLHYIDWSAKQGRPKTLGLADLSSLRATPALFARKFDAGTDGAILDALDRELLAPRHGGDREDV